MSIDCVKNGGIASVCINRPKRLNAFDTHLWQELRLRFDEISSDSEVRVVVLTSAGDRAFCAGIDLNDIPTFEKGSDVARVAKQIRAHILDFQDAVSSIERCAKPVICVLFGACFGLAIDIACAADIRFCAQNSKFSVKEVDVGLAADIGTLQRLPRIVGNGSWVREVSFTARSFGAEEALQEGFVSKTFPSKDTAIENAYGLARELQQKSPVALQATKHLLTYSRDHSVPDALSYTATYNSMAVQSGDILAVQTKKPFEKL